MVNIITQYLNYILFAGAFIVGFIVALFVANRTQVKTGLSKLFVFLGKANSEDNGNPSSTRVNVFIALTQWSAALTFGFIYTVICYQSLILAYAGILSGLAAGILGLKVAQKGKEADALDPTKSEGATP